LTGHYRNDDSSGNNWLSHFHFHGFSVSTGDYTRGWNCSFYFSAGHGLLTGLSDNNYFLTFQWPDFARNF
jgi:hypothetical protein